MHSANNLFNDLILLIFQLDISSIYNSLNEDAIRNQFKLLSFLNKTYNNDLYLENIKYQGIEPKSFEKEEFKELLLNKVYNMNGLFAGCSNLKYLPDISKWNIIN